MLRRNIVICLVLLPVAGCASFPEGAHPPKVHNPFPQLSRVAIVNFLNLSDDPTVDGRQFALAYYNELQSIPGFEVVSVRTVEIAMAEHKIQLRTPEDARRLAQILGVDVVVVGSVTDFDAYYPPRCGMQVQWIAANPGFHPIPPGYALPWGTTEEEYIPGRLVFEAEMWLARAQLETQSPVAGDQMPLPEGVLPPGPKQPNSEQPGAVLQTSAVEPASRPADDRTPTTDTTGKFAALFPADPRQTREFFRPNAPQPTPPVLWPPPSLRKSSPAPGRRGSSRRPCPTPRAYLACPQPASERLRPLLQRGVPPEHTRPGRARSRVHPPVGRQAERSKMFGVS